MTRTYLKLHLWLKAKCEKLTMRQRRIFFYSVSIVYLLCSAALIVSAFIPEKEKVKMKQNELLEENIKTGIPEIIDTPLRKDSLFRHETLEQTTT